MVIDFLVNLRCRSRQMVLDDVFPSSILNGDIQQTQALLGNDNLSPNGGVITSANDASL